MASILSRPQCVNHDLDSLGSVHYADLKPLQLLVQLKWDVAVHPWATVLGPFLPRIKSSN